MPSGVENVTAFNKVIDDYIAPWNNEIGKEVLFQHIRLLVPYNIKAVASDIAVTGQPTLIIWGEKDEHIPLKYAERLHREIPRSRLVVIPNANHLVLFDAPDAVAKALVDFVQGL